MVDWLSTNPSDVLSALIAISRAFDALSAKVKKEESRNNIKKVDLMTKVKLIFPPFKLEIILEDAL